jgi:hypothetical protein
VFHSFVTRTPVTKVSRILGQQASSSSRSNGQTLLINRLHLYRPARTQHRLWLTEYLCSINHPTGNPPRNLHIIHHIQGRTLRQVRLVNTLPAVSVYLFLLQNLKIPGECEWFEFLPSLRDLNFFLSSIVLIYIVNNYHKLTRR